MSRSKLFSQFKRFVAVAKFAEKHQLSSKDASQIMLEKAKQEFSRRQFLKNSSAGLAIFAVGGLGIFSKRAMAAGQDVAIVGAGLAGLTAAYELKKSNVYATVYEAANRVGGRQISLRNYFPGQVAERGGELIDNLHKTMLGYAQEFKLDLEDLSKDPGEIYYYFQGQHHDESVVVDQFREFVAAMRDDLNNISGEVTADYSTEYDRLMDNTSLEEYLNGKNSRGIVMGPVAKEAVRQAYIAEYGIDPSEQSVLNFLFFIHSDRRSKFQPFGVYSDERYHVTNGNDAIATNMAQRLSNQIEIDMQLVRVAKTSSGKIELTFKQGNRTIVRSHEKVIISIPFSVLRGVELHSSLAIPQNQVNAIQNLGYGYNAKMMIGFNGRPWHDLHNGNGGSYSDLPNLQATWETNPELASPSRGIITDYSGAARGKNIDPRRVQTEANKFINDFEKVFPGSKNFVNKNAAGNVLAHLEHWPSNPFSKGSYTAYKLGQFTSIAGLESKPVGNLFFAGEHTNSFYEWQGFMEGACLSGLAAAAEILKR